MREVVSKKVGEKTYFYPEHSAKKLSLTYLTFIQASVVIALPLPFLFAAHLQALYLRLESIHLRRETHSDLFRWIQMAFSAAKHEVLLSISASNVST